MTRNYEQLWKGITDKTDKTEAAEGLAKIVADNAGRDFILGSEYEEAELCVEILDHGITKLNLEPAEKNTFLVTLRRLAQYHKLLPRRMRMTEEIVVSRDALTLSGPGEIRMYKGQRVTTMTFRVPGVGEFRGPRGPTGLRRDSSLEDIQDITKVNINGIFTPTRSAVSAVLLQRFYRELVLWSMLSHANVLKLFAVEEDVKKTRFTTVSEWMDWTIMDYIEGYYVNRLELLHGAVQGLEYLHGIGLAHGNLKGANILVSVDEPPRACISGFGFVTTILDPGQEPLCSARSAGGTVRFMSPELIAPANYGKEDAKATQEADVYAFGLVIFQVLTGGIPFANMATLALVYYVPLGERPAKPENASAIGFSDSLWDFTERCWSGDIEARPKVGEVVTHLGEAAAKWDGLMPPIFLTWSPASSDDELDKFFLPVTI